KLLLLIWIPEFILGCTLKSNSRIKSSNILSVARKVFGVFLTVDPTIAPSLTSYSASPPFIDQPSKDVPSNKFSPGVLSTFGPSLQLINENVVSKKNNLIGGISLSFIDVLFIYG